MISWLQTHSHEHIVLRPFPLIEIISYSRMKSLHVHSIVNAIFCRLPPKYSPDLLRHCTWLWGKWRERGWPLPHFQKASVEFYNIYCSTEESNEKYANILEETCSDIVGKLFFIQDQEFEEIISWTQDGRSFQIHNTFRFTENLLPVFFKHNNMASFVRQLNMYGFNRQK